MDEIGVLEEIRGEWSELWDRCPYATPFQSPEWIIPWWRVFHPGSLRCLTLRRDGRLAGLAVLYVDASGLARLAGAGNSDYLDVLLEPGLGAGWIRDQAGRAEFQDLRQESPLAAGAPRVEESAVCPVLAVPPSVEQWRNSLSRSLRRNLRRYRDRLAPVSFETSADPCAIEHLFRLHSARWRALRGQAGVLADAGLRAFHREVAADFAARGWLRLYILRSAGSVVAVIYAFLCRGRAYLYLSGFDPGCARSSPGTVATGFAIESAIGEGVREIDFLRGGEPYKYAWGAKDRRSIRAGLD